MNSGAKYATDRGRLDEATQLARNAFAMAVRIGNNHNAVFEFQERLGNILHRNQYVTEAIEVFISLRDYVLLKMPDDRASLRSVHRDLGHAYIACGRYQEAGEEFEAAGRYVDMLSPIERYQCLVDKYSIQMSIGNVSEAIILISETYHLSVTMRGSEDWSAADHLFKLAVCFQKIDNYEESIPLLREAYRIQEKHFGSDSLYTCLSLQHLGLAFSQIRREYDWRGYFWRSIEILVKIRGSSHPDVAECYSRFGLALGQNGHYRQAGQYFRKALDILEPRFGDTDPTVSSILLNLGEAYLHFSAFGEAGSYFKRAGKAYESTYGRAHDTTIHVHLRYALTLEFLGNKIEAKCQLYELLKFFREKCHQTILDCLR